MLGKALIKAGRAADAAELFERYFEAMKLIFKGECRPSYHDFDSGDCYLLLAAAYIELGERERAVKCVEESVLYYRQLFGASDDGTAKISPESPFVKASTLCRRLSKEAVREKLRRKLATAELDALRDEPEFRRIAGLIEEI